MRVNAIYIIIIVTIMSGQLIYHTKDVATWKVTEAKNYY